jgi:hypothetical protein
MVSGTASLFPVDYQYCSCYMKSDKQLLPHSKKTKLAGLAFRLGVARELGGRLLRQGRGVARAQEQLGQTERRREGTTRQRYLYNKRFL